MTTDARSVIDRCVAGEGERAWEDFVGRFEPVLRRGVVSALNGTAKRWDGLEEDLLQEVYCRLLEGGAQHLKRCRERDEVAIRAFLARLARNAAIDHLRWRRTVKRGRRSLVSGDLAQRRFEQAANREPSAEDRLIMRQQGRSFLRACRRIGGCRTADRNVRVLALAFLGGLSSREIAQHLGRSLSPGSIDSLISRARKKLAAAGVALASRRLSP